MSKSARMQLPVGSAHTIDLKSLKPSEQVLFCLAGLEIGSGVKPWASLPEPAASCPSLPNNEVTKGVYLEISPSN